MGFAGATVQGAEEMNVASSDGPDDRPKIRGGELAAVLVGQLTLFMALVVPIGFSLAVKVGSIDPENQNTVLALALGIASTLVLFTNPVFGVLSDRTRSRFGRRRPWFVGGVLLGTVGSIVIAFSESTTLVIIGWCIGLGGYSLANQTLVTFLGDRLPRSQRGKVMGINGALTQIGPILGIVLAGMFTSNVSLMFLVPAGIAVLGAVWFVLAMKDPKFEGTVPELRFSALAKGFYFNPRKHSNFGWVIVSKVLVYGFIALTTLYTVYLLMARFELGTAEVASLTALISLMGVALAALGALGGGFLSDKLKSRKPFLVIAAGLLAASALTVATSTSIPQFVIGSLLTSLGLGVYGSVDQALLLDVLPSEGNENGRYLSIFFLANGVPQAIGPFLAAAVLSLAGGDYSWVYFVGAAFAALGALAIIPISVGKRASLSTTSIRTM
ncbi:MFS transporter [Herbiconiux sp. CPCC 203407]|uniref:MFS transporter n=1 Tax=Herbiconiux oxytropis TaxID=2970915 RepID=A0AA42BW21_9MICO|nr:MFS transporter [Herbiconiux oxytropis]MCS5721843.1 MFS transporter [Herbiconiux oxytropis]MCS5727369.1 MFS transporter [Herbiconiux oxytropis]